MSERPPETLLSVPVFARDGSVVPMSEVLRPCPVLVLFLRHFGCIGCEVLLAELLPRVPEICRLGVRVVLIGNGTAEQLSDFLTRQGLEDQPIEGFTDPTLAAFQALELPRSIFSTYGPRAIWTVISGTLRGLRNRKGGGDDTQQGGALLLDESGSVLLLKRNQHVGDHVDPSEVLDLAMKSFAASTQLVASETGSTRWTG